MSVRNIEGQQQFISFDGFDFNGCHPTDVDAALDYKGKCLIWIEFKFGDAEVKKGQRIFLERVVDNSKVPSIAMVCSHNCEVKNGALLAMTANVRSFYQGKGWEDGKGLTVERFMEQYLEYIERGQK